MSTNVDGLSSPLKRRRNGGNLIDFFKIENSKKHCTYPNCNKSFSLATSTTDLMHHLSSEHKVILIDKDQGDKNSNSTLDAKKQEQIDELLIKILADKKLNITMSESFRKFIHAVQPKYIIPDEAIIKQKLLEKSEKLKPKIDNISIDSD